VHIFNHRTVAGIFDMIAMIGAMVGAQWRAQELIEDLRKRLQRIEQSAARLARRPRVYFEEWDEPLISGIGWVSELTGLAGGDDCFPELARESSAKQRIIADPAEVVRRAPDIVIGSWCGKKFQPERVCARNGWDKIPAVQQGHVYEIKSPNILQPGPAALTDGVEQIHSLVQRWAQVQA
jgi:iron complex transport system substrate-binding protein